MLAGLADPGGASPVPSLALSRDTLVEKPVFFHKHPVEQSVYLVNGTNRLLRVDSIEIRLDRRVFKSFSMDFQVFSSAEPVNGLDKVFYWSEDSVSFWMSAPLWIPARDSLRIFELRIDRCSRCNAEPGRPGSREIIAPVIFKSGKNVATLYVKGWYLMPSPRILSDR